ncbi:MAG: hypothetical protein E6848_22385, partial [Bradyrhizobium sp.]|nr:hypothetical protein [Bradyrhizobium sp.]
PPDVVAPSNGAPGASQIENSGPIKLVREAQHDNRDADDHACDVSLRTTSEQHPRLDVHNRTYNH